mmetsp:Transcript_2127/g.5072  ORF Transcript_2127/g.5072 Transcript_2127/m.5072 type:complete len:162 (+) Transcript_2127:47-532(+)
MASVAVLLRVASSLALVQQSSAEGLRVDHNTTQTTKSPIGLPPLSAAGACTSEDEATMANLGAGNADGTFPSLVASCGRRNWSLFGGLITREFQLCLQRDTQVTEECASCFSLSAVHAFHNCKFACMSSSWCSLRCLRCVDPSIPELKQCAGVALPGATPC